MTIYINCFYKERNKSYRLLRSYPHSQPYWQGSCFIALDTIAYIKEKGAHEAKCLFIITTEPLRAGRMYNPKKILPLVPKRMEYDAYVKANAG